MVGVKNANFVRWFGHFVSQTCLSIFNILCVSFCMLACCEESRSLEYTPTWIIGVVCFVIVLISFIAERGLHRLGKCFVCKHQDALFDALQRLKEELMLLGFISLLLSAFQDIVSHICISPHLASIMLPCKFQTTSSGSHESIMRRRRLLPEDISSEHCARKGKVPFLSLEALHQLHIFIFVLALVHVIFCATTMVLGGAEITQWRLWEHSVKNGRPRRRRAHSLHRHLEHFKERAGRYWRKTTIVSWMVAFFKQFYGSVSKSDYVALREGFIRAHIPERPHFDFHEYMLRMLGDDFKRIVGISWYLWLFVVIFLLMNIEGWHTYFWLSFLPLVLLLLVGAKLEHIISVLAKELAERETGNAEAAQVKPSDELFWFHRPDIVLYLIHFILFQNSFEIAFFFWIWVTYGFKTCIMEKLGFIIPKLVIGVMVQVLSSYSTLPLYALVTQMGSKFKQELFDEHILGLHFEQAKETEGGSMAGMATEPLESISIADRPTAGEGITASMIELSKSNKRQTSPS